MSESGALSRAKQQGARDVLRRLLADEIVEIAARALCAERGWDWHEDSELAAAERDRCRDLARTVLGAAVADALADLDA